VLVPRRTPCGGAVGLTSTLSGDNEANRRTGYLGNTNLGRVDGFDQDEARDEGDEGCKVPFGFLAA